MGRAGGGREYRGRCHSLDHPESTYFIMYSNLRALLYRPLKRKKENTKKEERKGKKKEKKQERR